MQNATLFYSGGVTLCTMKEKIRLMNIKHAEGKNCGMSEYIADQMAMEIALIFDTERGIGITGYLSPIRESGYRMYMRYSTSVKNR